MEANFKLIEIYMKRASGYGQYKIVATFEAYGEKHTVSIHSTDSQLWDNDDKTEDELLNHIGGEEELLNHI